MARYSKPRKNSKRIDPRYFLDETADRESLEERGCPPGPNKEKCEQARAKNRAKNRGKQGTEERPEQNKKKAAEERFKNKNENQDLKEQEEQEEVPVPVQSDTLTPEDTSRLAEDAMAGLTLAPALGGLAGMHLGQLGGLLPAAEVNPDKDWWDPSLQQYPGDPERWAHHLENEEILDLVPGDVGGGREVSFIPLEPGDHGEYFPAALQESFSYKLEEAMQRSVLAIANDVAEIVGNKDPQTVMNIFDMVYSTLFPGQGAPAGDMLQGSSEDEEGHGEHASAKRIGFTIAEDTFPALESIVAEELAFMRETLATDADADDLPQPLEEQ